MFRYHFSLCEEINIAQQLGKKSTCPDSESVDKEGGMLSGNNEKQHKSLSLQMKLYLN